jgi:hypothetical protein
MPVVFQDGIADGNAFVADISTRIVRGGGDQLSNNVLTLVTKGTAEGIIGASSFHRDLLGCMVRFETFSLYLKIGGTVREVYSRIL